MPDVEWMPEPEEHDYPAAAHYLPCHVGENTAIPDRLVASVGIGSP